MTKDELFDFMQKYVVLDGTVNLELSDIKAGYLVLTYQTTMKEGRLYPVYEVGIIWEVPEYAEQKMIDLNTLRHLAGRVDVYKVRLVEEHPGIRFTDGLVSFSLYTNAELSHEAEDYATENKISVTYHI